MKLQVFRFGKVEVFESEGCARRILNGLEMFYLKGLGEVLSGKARAKDKEL